MIVQLVRVCSLIALLYCVFSCALLKNQLLKKRIPGRNNMNWRFGQMLLSTCLIKLFIKNYLFKTDIFFLSRTITVYKLEIIFNRKNNLISLNSINLMPMLLNMQHIKNRRRTLHLSIKTTIAMVHWLL